MNKGPSSFTSLLCTSTAFSQRLEQERELEGALEGSVGRAEKSKGLEVIEVKGQKEGRGQIKEKRKEPRTC